MPAIVEPITRAGQLLRAWRQAHALTGMEAAARLGISMATLYRVENGTRGKASMATAQVLVTHRICAHEDFHRAPDPVPDPVPDHVAACEACGEAPDGPVARCCTRGDCPRRVKDAA